MAKIIKGVEESIKYLSEQKIDQQIKEANIKNFQSGGFDALEIKDEGTEGEEILFRRIPEEAPEDIHTIMNDIQALLQDEDAKGLLVEVLAYSFQYLKGNSQATIRESLNFGYSEWIK